MPKGASANTDVTPGSVEFGFLSVGNDPGKWVFPMLQFGLCVFENYSLSGKPGASDHLIQDWWNWSHDLWQLLTPSTKSIAALSVYPSKMNSGFLGLVFLALSPRA